MADTGGEAQGDGHAGLAWLSTEAAKSYPHPEGQRRVEASRYPDDAGSGNAGAALACARSGRGCAGGSQLVRFSLEPVHRSFSRHYSNQYGKLQQQDQMLANVQQMHEMRVVRERTKGDRMEEHRKEARNAEDREAADNSIYDLIDQHIAYKAGDE